MADSGKSISLAGLARRSAEELARVCGAASFVVDESGVVVEHGTGDATPASSTPASSTVAPPPLGTCVDDSVRDVHRERFRAAREQAFTTGTPRVCENYTPAAHCVPLADDETVWETRFLPTDVENGPRYLLVVTRDVSWRAAALGLAGSLRRDLAHVLRLLTTGSLVTEAAHDLMQPLGGMVSFADGALLRTERREAIPADEVRDWLETLRVQALEAAGAIRRMRDFARRTPHPLEPLDGPVILAEAVRLVTAQARSSGVRIDLPASLETVRIQGRAVELRQVFVNLLLNGIEARRAAPSEKVVRIESTADDSRWRVSIADDGCGIPDEARTTLFEPFVTSKPDGLGLGLSIGKSILEDHGGTIRLVPRSHPGAVFEVTLPRIGSVPSATGGSGGDRR